MRTAIAVLVLALSAVAAAPAAAACPGADATVRKGNLPEARAALRCLIDERRAEAGREAYGKSPKLTRISRRFVKQMRDEDFFGHTSPDGETRSDRYEAAGYDHRGAENLAHGWATPRIVFDNWMESRIHRSNILSRRWQYIGIGIVVGGSRDRLYSVTFGPARS